MSVILNSAYSEDWKYQFEMKGIKVWTKRQKIMNIKA